MNNTHSCLFSVPIYLPIALNISSEFFLLFIIQMPAEVWRAHACGQHESPGAHLWAERVRHQRHPESEGQVVLQIAVHCRCEPQGSGGCPGQRVRTLTGNSTGFEHANGSTIHVEWCWGECPETTLPASHHEEVSSSNLCPRAPLQDSGPGVHPW